MLPVRRIASKKEDLKSKSMGVFKEKSAGPIAFREEQGLRRALCVRKVWKYTKYRTKR